MRLATLILGVVTLALSLTQTIIVGGVAIFDEDFERGALFGGLFLLAMLLAIAFAYGIPLFAAILFACAGALGVTGGRTTLFEDLLVWGVVAILLAALSLGGAHEKGQSHARRLVVENLLGQVVAELQHLNRRNSTAEPDSAHIASLEKAASRPPSSESVSASLANWPRADNHRAVGQPLVSLHAQQTGERSAALSVDPPFGYVGTQIRAEVEGIEPGATVNLVWVGSDGVGRVLAQQPTSPHGASTLSCLVPEGVQPGAYKLFAVMRDRPLAMTQFGVLPQASNAQHVA